MPSPVCSICSRRDAGAINGLLLEGRSVLSVAREFSLSEDALQNHNRKGHTQRRVIPTIPRAKSAKTPDDPLDELVILLREQALSGGAGNPAIVHQYRLALQTQKEAKNGAPVGRDLEAEPEWIAMRSKMLKALENYPEARIAIAEALA